MNKYRFPWLIKVYLENPRCMRPLGGPKFCWDFLSIFGEERGNLDWKKVGIVQRRLKREALFELMVSTTIKKKKERYFLDMSSTFLNAPVLWRNFFIFTIAYYFLYLTSYTFCWKTICLLTYLLKLWMVIFKIGGKKLLAAKVSC